MSQFYNAKDREIDNIIGSPHNISELPTHIIESTQFKCWQSLFPEETEYCIKDNLFVKDFNIKSQADLDRIIDADCELGFNQNTRIEILKNIEYFWKEDPNSAPIRLPKEGYSIFADQVRVLFKEIDEMALVCCMKNGYIELFNYIYEREKGNINRDKSFNTHALLHYAILNGHIEMIKRGIEIGLPITDILIRPAIDNGDVEIFQLLFEHNIEIRRYGLIEVCQHAPPEMFKIFLNHYIYKLGNNPSNLILYAVKNLVNLKELVLNNDIALAESWGRKFACELLDECVNHSLDMEVVLFVEQHFDITMQEFKEYYNKNYSKHYFINMNVIYNDNYELYNYLYINGFKVDNEILSHVTKYRRHRITPALVEKHIKESFASSW